MRDPSDQLQCSFCGKSQRQVRKLIAGPGVYICDECIELCNEIIDEEFSGPELLKDDDLPKPREINRILNEYVIGQDEAKTIRTDGGKNVVRLTPVLPAGFGCPCHGGQYDTEGNPTAGPPVRALDRSEFSIIDGNLVLGNLYSVAKVEGQGARARIYKYGKVPPGVHVDGASAWLYPIEVPR